MDNIADFLSYLHIKAEASRIAARLNGGFDDGGAARLEEQISVYRAGSSDRIPVVWKTDYTMFNNQQDPDYKIYLKLKEKFE